MVTPNQPSPTDPPLDTRYRVETPEQIGLEYDIAGLGTRLMAAIVDMIFLGLIAGLVLCVGTIGLTAVSSAIGEGDT
ncbi:MAG: RDD family protein, partial [Vicinamibacterales bacterium]